MLLLLRFLFFPVTFNPRNHKKFFSSSIFLLFNILWSIFNQKWKFSKYFPVLLVYSLPLYCIIYLNLTTLNSSQTYYINTGELLVLFVYCLHTINMVVLFFQLKLKMTVHVALTKKKICEVNNVWYFLRRANFILVFCQKELASPLSVASFSRNLEG